jgi:DNA polymerase-1
LRLIAFDAETYLIQPGNLTPKPVVASFCSPGTSATLVLPDPFAALLRGWLRDPLVHFVGHNVAFDFGVFTHHYPDLMPLVFQAYADGRVSDTKIYQQLIDIARGEFNKIGYSLADLGSRWLGKDRSEEKQDPSAWRYNYQKLDGVPLDQWPEEAKRYALTDAEDTLAIILRQREKHRQLPTEADQYRAAWALHLLSVHGVRTEGTRVSTLKSKLLAEQGAARVDIKAAGLLKLAPFTKEDKEAGREPDGWIPYKRTPKTGPAGRPARWAKDMAAITARVLKAYEVKGRSVPLTETGKPSTDRDTLTLSGDPVLEALGEASAIEKLLTTYVPVLEQGTKNAINARFNVLVTSGRTSSSSPNLQNIPTGRKGGGVRECFVPRPGTVFVSCDYNAIELRMLAQFCYDQFGRSDLADAFLAGQDPHTLMAAEILGLDYEDAVKLRAEGDTAVENARDAAKVANFGYPGGMGETAFLDYARTGYGLEISAKQAADLKRFFLKTWREMGPFFNHVARLVGEGTTQLMTPYTDFLRGDVGYCDGCNHHFQSPTASGVKRALFQIQWECWVDKGTALYNSRPWAMVHDEILAEMPEGNLHEAAARLEEVAEEQMSTIITHVPVKTSTKAMTVWSKDAKRLLKDGRLVAWSPKV